MFLLLACCFFWCLVTSTRCFALRFIYVNVFLRIHRNPNRYKINTPYVSNLIFAFFCCFTVFARFCSMFCRFVLYVYSFLNTACKYKPWKSLHHMCQTCFCCWLAVFWCLVTSTRCFALRFICMDVFLRIHRNPNRYKINTPYVSNLIFAFFCCFTVFARFCLMFCRSVLYVYFFEYCLQI